MKGKGRQGGERRIRKGGIVSWTAQVRERPCPVRNETPRSIKKKKKRESRKKGKKKREKQRKRERKDQKTKTYRESLGLLPPPTVPSVSPPIKPPIPPILALKTPSQLKELLAIVLVSSSGRSLMTDNGLPPISYGGKPTVTEEPGKEEEEEVEIWARPVVSATRLGAVEEEGEEDR